jgi:RND family efflux transporter MFP subunit
MQLGNKHLFTGLFFLGLAIAGCSSEAPPGEPPPPKVTVRHPEQRQLVDYDRYNGWTEPAKTVEVRSRVRGHLTKVHFQDGQLVKEGDRLFEIDPRPYQTALDAAEAQVAAAVASQEFANAEYARISALVARGAATREEQDVWAAKRATSKGEVLKAEAEVKRAKLDLEYTKITAPINGKISRAQLTEGNLVNAGGSDPLLTTIVSINPIHVFFTVDERSCEQ